MTVYVLPEDPSVYWVDLNSVIAPACDAAAPAFPEGYSRDPLADALKKAAGSTDGVVGGEAKGNKCGESGIKSTTSGENSANKGEKCGAENSASGNGIGAKDTDKGESASGNGEKR